MTDIQNFLELDGMEIRERLRTVVDLLEGIQKASDYDDTSACSSLATLALEAFNTEEK